MLTLSVFMRGGAKLSGSAKPKPPKCPLSAVRRSLQALQQLKKTWRENPGRLISAKLHPITNKKLKLSTLLSHKLSWLETLKLLTANLSLELQPLIQLLRRKPFLYQIATMWLHMTYFQTPPSAISWLLSTNGFDCCWICKRQHFPFHCQKSQLQRNWKTILAGIIFCFQNHCEQLITLQLRKMDAAWPQFIEYLCTIRAYCTNYIQCQRMFPSFEVSLSRKFPTLRDIFNKFTVEALP